MTKPKNLHQKRTGRGLQFVGGYMAPEVVKRIDGIARLLGVPRSEALRVLIMNANIETTLPPVDEGSPKTVISVSV